MPAETYINTHARSARCLWFPRGSKSRRPRGFIYKVFILQPIKSFLSLATKLRAFLSLASKVPSNGYSSNSQRVSSLSSYLPTVYLATIQLSTGSATLASVSNTNSERLRMRPKCPALLHVNFLVRALCLATTSTSAFSNGNYLWLPLKLQANSM